MPHVNLRDDNVTLLNPCPSITERDLTDRAGLMVPGPEVEAFPISIKWSSGSEGEEVTLMPGQTRVLAAPIARSLEKHFRHRGLVIVEDHESELDARIAGLTSAIRFFRERGADSIVEIQAARGWTDEQVGKMRDSGLRSQHMNLERERVLTEELTALRARAADERRAAKKGAKAA